MSLRVMEITLGNCRWFPPFMGPGGVYLTIQKQGESGKKVKTYESYGCFLKWWYPQIIHFNKTIHFGVPPFRKTPIWTNQPKKKNRGLGFGIKKTDYPSAIALLPLLRSKPSPLTIPWRIHGTDGIWKPTWILHENHKDPPNVGK